MGEEMRVSIFFLIGLFLVSCEDKAAGDAVSVESALEAETAGDAVSVESGLEAEAAAVRALIAAKLSFCRNMSLYAEQSSLDESIILAEAQALGFDVSDKRVGFSLIHNIARTSVLAQVADAALSRFAGVVGGDAEPSGGVYVASCLEAFDSWGSDAVLI